MRSTTTAGVKGAADPVDEPVVASDPTNEVNPLVGSHVLICEGNAAETTALQTIVGGEGARIDIVTDGRSIVEAAKRHKPAVILIDTGMNGLDLGYVGRILSRHPATAASALLLVAPPKADERKLRALREQEAFAILTRPLTCSAIRENFAAAAAFHVEQKQMRGGSSAGRGSNKFVHGCSALLRRELSCPFHSFGVPIDYYQLRTGKVYSETDIFDVPVYKDGGLGDFVDYNLAGIAICRECFFATSDANYFDDPNGSIGDNADDAAAKATYKIDHVTRQKITGTSGHRGLSAHDRLGCDPDDDFFSWNRDLKQSLVAYEVAIQSSRTLYEAAPVRRSVELLRLGGYELRRAMLQEKLGVASERVMKHRAAAAAWLGKAFGEVKGGGMYKAAYQLVAINVHLGREAQAFQYLGALREQTRLSIRDQEDPASLERYLRRAQNLWEDRDRHRSPAVVTKKEAA